MPPNEKRIEVALPLDSINAACVWEKSIRRGHPSTLHLRWARRSLAACRAVLFAQLVHDPSGHPDRSGGGRRTQHKFRNNDISDFVEGRWKTASFFASPVAPVLCARRARRPGDRGGRRIWSGIASRLDPRTIGGRERRWSHAAELCPKVGDGPEGAAYHGG